MTQKKKLLIDADVASILAGLLEACKGSRPMGWPMTADQLKRSEGLTVDGSAYVYDLRVEVLTLLAEVYRLRSIEAAARIVRAERNSFLQVTAGSGCVRSPNLEEAERVLDALLDASGEK